MKYSIRKILSMALVILCLITFMPTAAATTNNESKIHFSGIDSHNRVSFWGEEGTPEETTTGDPAIVNTPTESSDQAENSPTPTPDYVSPSPESTCTPDETPADLEDPYTPKSTTPGWGIDQAGNPCYYLDIIGTKATNYFYVNGKLYYAYPRTGIAIRARGWFTRDDGVRCYAFDGGWLTPARFTYNGNDYYVNYGGTVIANQYMNISGSYYYAGHDGVIKKNGFFTRTDGVVCYAAGADGSIQMSPSITSIGGKVYYIQSAGVVAKNQYFLDSSSNLRYVQADGSVITSRGWFIRADGVKCYAWTNGILIAVRFTDTDGNDYYVNYGGTVIAGQYMNISGSLFYAGYNGVIKKHGYFTRDDGVVCYAVGSDGSIRPALVMWDDGSCHSVNDAGNIVQITTRRSLLIGNSDYIGTVNDLNAPPRDIAAMERVLSKSTFYFNNGYRSIIKNNQSASNMKALMYNAFSGATGNDISLFYYSGHGIVGGSSAGAIIGVDGNLITPAQVKSILDGIPGRKIIFIDACGSGAYVKGVKDGELIKSPEMSASEEMAAIKSFNDAWTQAFSTTSKSGEFANQVGSLYTVITACDDDESSYEVRKDSGIYYGIFSDALTWGGGFDMWTWQYSDYMQADHYGTADNVTTASELYSYMRQYIISEFGYEPQTVQRAIPLDDMYMQDGSMPIFVWFSPLSFSQIARGLDEHYVELTN